jgi:hypothetical protein
MSRKRTSLDSILSRTVEAARPATPPSATPPSSLAAGAGRATRAQPNVKQQTAYLPAPVHEQLRRLAFEERAKMHDYLIEGLDLVFRKRGLPGVDELNGRESRG